MARASIGPDPRASELLTYWFGDDPDDATVASRQAALWWRHDPAVDAEIASRFGGLARAAAAGRLDTWRETPRGRLALVLALDQLPRMIYRDTEDAFATDERARSECRQAVALGDDTALRPIEQLFLLLPLEHSESLDDQEECLRRLQRLAGSVPNAWHATFAGFVDFSVRHRDIIARFGRFPHRNHILGRPSTAAETAFLREPDSSF